MSLRARLHLPLLLLGCTIAAIACGPAAAPTPTPPPTTPPIAATPGAGTATAPIGAASPTGGTITAFGTPSASGTVATSATASRTTTPGATVAPGATSAGTGTPAAGAARTGTPAAGTTGAGAPAAGATKTVTLAPQNNSGVSGTATLTDLGNGKTRVEITVTPATGNHPAHIHEGTCANLNPTPRYPLNNVQNGTSTTEISVPLADLTRTPMAINLHKSPQEVSVYVACGDIK